MDLHSFASRLAVASVACARAGGTCTVVFAVLTVSVAVASALSRHEVAIVRFAAYGGFWLVPDLVALGLRQWH